MNNINDESNIKNGNIQIDTNAIISIINMAIKSIENNAVKIEPKKNTIVDNISDMIGYSKHDHQKAIYINMDNKNNLNVSVYVSVKYGINIPIIGKQIQEAIIKQAKEAIGYTIQNVSVIVQNII